MAWAAFLLSIAWPLVKKVLIALGVGYVSYVGYSAIQEQIAGAIQSQLGALASDTYQLLALAGFIDAVGIMLGGLAAVAALMAIRRLGVLSS